MSNKSEESNKFRNSFDDESSGDENGSSSNNSQSSKPQIDLSYSKLRVSALLTVTSLYFFGPLFFHIKNRITNNCDKSSLTNYFGNILNAIPLMISSILALGMLTPKGFIVDIQKNAKIVRNFIIKLIKEHTFFIKHNKTNDQANSQTRDSVHNTSFQGSVKIILDKSGAASNSAFNKYNKIMNKSALRKVKDRSTSENKEKTYMSFANMAYGFLTFCILYGYWENKSSGYYKSSNFNKKIVSKNKIN